MAQDDKITFEPSLDFIFDKLQDALHNLLDKFRKISLKNKDLKIKYKSLTKKMKKSHKIINF